jgi:hypothetical protein
VKNVDFNNSTEPYEARRIGTGYHYSYGRHPQYAPVTQRQPYTPVNQPNSKRIFFSGQPVPGIDDGPQTIEQILNHGYMDLPAGQIETAIIQDKQHTSWLGLDDVLGQIREREQIYRKNMLEIEWSKCYAFNEVARTGWPASTKQWELYQKQIQSLHTQQREERVLAWQDISKLRQLLPESIQQYLSASRKSDLLGGPDGDAL